MIESSRLQRAITALFDEIAGGSAAGGGWLLNPRDPGLLVSLRRLTAAQASTPPRGGGASIAAHVEHLRYGFELLNRTTTGENPFGDADWTAAWKENAVSDDGWADLLGRLRDEIEQWRSGFPRLLEAGEMELTGILASVAHLAYHTGAIRQIDRAAGGPSAEAGG